jgi:hypothetical protein
MSMGSNRSFELKKSIEPEWYGFCWS